MRANQIAWALVGLLGCRAETTDEPSANADAAGVEASERDIGVLQLSPEEREHLGLETATIGELRSKRTRMVGGFVVSPADAVRSVSAPLAGVLHAGEVEVEAGARVEAGALLMRLTPLAPVDRDLRAQAQRQRDATQVRVELAQAKVERVKALLDDKASSQRALEEASAELEVAEGDDRAAKARIRALQRAPLDADVSLDLVAPISGVIRTVGAAPGQAVGSGTVVVDLVGDRLWLRVPVYAGEVDEVAEGPVRVTRLGHEFGPLRASPVLAPPSADPLSTTVDRFYALDDTTLHSPGERVLVELPFRDEVPRLAVPSSALITDIAGGMWIYECLPGDRFRRQRVEVLRREGDMALLSRSPPEGTCVVAVGAMELFGSEFAFEEE